MEKQSENSFHTYTPIGTYLKHKFGSKVIKLSLDGGFTCPNRDGSKGVGGCLFCSSKGSGEFAGNIPQQIALLSKKWPQAKYIAYFQNHTGTYAPVEQLREKYYAALEDPQVVGLAVATRPDCLSTQILDLLSELNEKTFLWVELGLQTIHEETALLMNRCYPLAVYDSALEALSARGIKVVVHLIFGLPKYIVEKPNEKHISLIPETREEMLDSVRYITKPLPRGRGDYIFGVKFHLLNVVKGSELGALAPDYEPFASMDDYITLVCDAIAMTPSRITIHRMTADAKRDILLTPEWSYKKRTILNGITAELKSRKIFPYSDPSLLGPNLPSL